MTINIFEIVVFHTLLSLAAVQDVQWWSFCKAFCFASAYFSSAAHQTCYNKQTKNANYTIDMMNREKRFPIQDLRSS